MEVNPSSSFIKKQDNRTNPVNKRKRIRKIVPGICQYCNKWFTDNRSVYAHVRIHTGEKPFVCSVCHKGFKQSSQMKRHAAIHTPTERKVLSCNFCGKQYIDKQCFEEHVLAHAGKKPYMCEVCFKTFAFRNRYQRHLLDHDPKLKKFPCKICEESFASDYLRRNHMEVHNREKKSYECTLCRKDFTRNYHLERHLKNIHNITIAFQCKICKKHFPNIKTLNKHYPSHRFDEYSKACREELDTTNESEQRFQEDVTQNKDLSNKHVPGDKNLEKCYLSLNEDKGSETSQDKSENKNKSVQRFEKEIAKASCVSEACSNNVDETEPIEDFECEETEINPDPISPEPKQDIDDSATNNRYFCGVCYQEISDKTNIQEHLCTHKQEYVYACYNCKKIFNSTSLFTQHVCSTDTDLELFQCNICEKIYCGEENFRKHRSTHAEEDST